MPIRFRCVYCDQLLGISRRKAGTTVRCTTCNGQLIVPDAAAATERSDEEPAAPPAAQEPPAGGQLFERDDFDQVLEPFQFQGSPAAVADPPASIRKERPSSLSPSPALPTLVRNLTLTRRQLTIATVAAVLALGFSFAIGLWVGLSLH